MQNRFDYFPIKMKKKNLRVITRKKIPFEKRKILFIALFVSVFFSIILVMGYMYFGTQARINHYIQNEKYMEAIQLINGLLKENPSDPFALKTKGEIYFLFSIKQDLFNSGESQTIDYSIQSFLKLLKTKNKEYISSDVYFFLGCNYFLKANGDKAIYKQALKYLEQGVEQDRKDGKIKEYLARNSIEIRLENKLFSISLYALLGYISYNLEEYNRAISYFEKAIQEKDAVVIYHLYLALSYRNIKNYEKAIDVLEFVILKEEEPDIKIQGYYVLSNIFIKQKEYNQAIRYLKKAQTILSTAEGYYQIGLVYEAKKQIASAVRYWRKAINMDSKHDGSRRKLYRYEQKFTKQPKKR